MAHGLDCRVVRYGVGEECEIHGSAFSARWPARLSMKARLGGKTLDVETKLVGTHWASSVLSVMATIDVLGIDVEKALAAIGEVQPFMARMQPMQLPCGAIVIRDEGNGSADTFDAMLKVLKEAKARRRVLVITDMTDSKEKPRKRQRALGRFAAEHTDIALFLGDHGHHAVKAAIANGMRADNCLNIMSFQVAADFLNKELGRGDLVFLKGRMIDHLSRIAIAQFGEHGCWKHTCPRTYQCDVCQQLKPSFDLALLSKNIEIFPGES